MALKTHKNISTLTKEIAIEYCKPENIAIPTDIITLAKNKGKKIEDAIKKHGPGIFTKLRRDEDKKKDVEKLIEAILNPYETLCFYENYFKGTSNFQKIDDVFEKVRKQIEKAANKSKKFKNSFEYKDIIYDKNEIKNLKYSKNPDNDKITGFKILKMEDGTSAKPFAACCADIINMGFKAYENAHNQFKETKQDLAKKLSENNSKYYEGFKNKCSQLTRVFKENVIPISDKIEELINMANTKKSIFQLKLFKASNSKFLPQLIIAKTKLDSNIQQTNNTINLLTSYKYGGYSDDVQKVNDNIDNLYYSTKNLYNKLSLNNIDYNKIQKELNRIIDAVNDIDKEVTCTSKNLNAKLATNIKEKEGNFKQISSNLDKKITELNDSSIDTKNQIQTVVNEIKEFQESYSAKEWAKWLAQGGITLLISGLSKLNEIVLKLPSYMAATKIIFPDNPDPIPDNQ